MPWLCIKVGDIYWPQCGVYGNLWIQYRNECTERWKKPILTSRSTAECKWTPRIGLVYLLLIGLLLVYFSRSWCCCLTEASLTVCSMFQLLGVFFLFFKKWFLSFHLPNSLKNYILIQFMYCFSFSLRILH